MEDIQSQGQYEDDFEEDLPQLDQEVAYNEIYVWGGIHLKSQQFLDDSQGQLGLCGQRYEKFIQIPEICSYNVVIKSISCGLSHSVFVSDQGHIYTMGSNEFGQLGIGDKSVKSKNLPTLIESLVDYVIVNVTSGNNHNIALSENGLVFSWGYGSEGALGSGGKKHAFTPLALNFSEAIREASAGGNHSAFISVDDYLYVCGSCKHGQTGVIQEDPLLDPNQILENIKNVACGEHHTLVMTNDNTLIAAGSNEHFQLGLPEQNQANEFYEIEFFTGKQLIDIKCWNMSVAIDNQHNIFIWGSLFDKESKQSIVIQKPQMIGNIKCSSVQVSSSFIAIIEKQSQSLKLMGTNSQGELGFNDKSPRNHFIHFEVPDSLNNKVVKQIGAGKQGFIIAVGKVQNQDDKPASNLTEVEQMEQIMFDDASPIKQTHEEDNMILLLKVQNNELINQVQELKEQVKHHKEIYQHDINEITGIVSNKDQQLKEYEQQNLMLIQQLSHSQQDLAMKTKELNEQKALNNNLQNDLLEQSRKNQELQASKSEPEIIIQETQPNEQIIEENQKLQSKVQLLEYDKSKIKTHCEILEKKVASLINFLEEERKLRHDYEIKMKELALKELEQEQKMKGFLAKTEQINHKEKELMKQIEALVEDAKIYDKERDTMRRNGEILTVQNRELKGQLELQGQKMKNLEKEIAFLYSRVDDKRPLSQLSSNQQSREQLSSQEGSRSTHQSSTREQKEYQLQTERSHIANQQPSEQNQYSQRKSHFQLQPAILRNKNVGDKEIPQPQNTFGIAKEILFQQRNAIQNAQQELLMFSPQPSHRAQTESQEFLSSNDIRPQNLERTQNIKHVFSNYKDQNQDYEGGRRSSMNKTQTSNFKEKENSKPPLFSPLRQPEYQSLQNFNSTSHHHHTSKHQELVEAKSYEDLRSPRIMGANSRPVLQISEFSINKESHRGITPFQLQNSNQPQFNNNVNYQYIQGGEEDKIMKGIKEKLDLLQRNKTDLESKIHTFEHQVRYQQRR